MEESDKKKSIKIGVFDSGIGGYTILQELFRIMPKADFYYISDDANAPYGPKSDEFITDRTFAISEKLLKQNVDLIVVACNTATAASIDALRAHFPNLKIVGVEPYLNAYYKMPEGLSEEQKKMVVLTTESTGKSERFKRLKERLDPESNIDHFGLQNLARLIEDFYYARISKDLFEQKVQNELDVVSKRGYSFAILGCTHYPLIKNLIEHKLGVETISPCRHIASRVKSLLDYQDDQDKVVDFYYFLSTKDNQWKKKERKTLLGPYQG